MGARHARDHRVREVRGGVNLGGVCGALVFGLTRGVGLEAGGALWGEPVLLKPAERVRLAPHVGRVVTPQSVEFGPGLWSRPTEGLCVRDPKRERVEDLGEARFGVERLARGVRQGRDARLAGLAHKKGGLVRMT